MKHIAQNFTKSRMTDTYYRYYTKHLLHEEEQIKFRQQSM